MPPFRVAELKIKQPMHPKPVNDFAIFSLLAQVAQPLYFIGKKWSYDLKS